MASEKPVEASHTEDARAADPNSSPAKLKEVKVQSVELANAIAQDKPSYTTRSQLQLYAFMLLCTLSKHTSSRDHLQLALRRQL